MIVLIFFKPFLDNKMPIFKEYGVLMINQGRTSMISEEVQFDQIIVLIVRI